MCVRVYMYACIHHNYTQYTYVLRLISTHVASCTGHDDNSTRSVGRFRHRTYISPVLTLRAKTKRKEELVFLVVPPNQEQL